MKAERVKLKEQNIKHLKKEYVDLKKQQEKLNLEIGKALIGESAFTPEQLSLALETIEKQMEEKSALIHSLSIPFHTSSTRPLNTFTADPISFRLELIFSSNS